MLWPQAHRALLILVVIAGHVAWSTKPVYLQMAGLQQSIQLCSGQMACAEGNFFHPKMHKMWVTRGSTALRLVMDAQGQWTQPSCRPAT